MTFYVVSAFIALALVESFFALCQRSTKGLLWTGGGVVAASAVWGAGGLVSPGPILTAHLPEGLLAFQSTPWNGFFILAVTLLSAAVGLVLRAENHPPGTWMAWAWSLLAADAFLASASPLALVACWGLLALGVYGLLVAGAEDDRTFSAAWSMLVMTELGAVMLLVGAIMLNQPVVHGSLEQTVILLLGVLGLGSKAGIFPFQLWMPVAEPEAPGSLAGMLSGIFTMVAMVGVWQWVHWVPLSAADASVVGWILVLLGLLGALLGMVHAVVDRDFKRVLAYSSAEWMGLAFLLLGLMMVFRVNGLAQAGALAEDGFFILLLMHAGTKLAVFIAAEWVEKSTGTRAMNQLGGLHRAAGSMSRWLLLPLVALMAVPPTGGYLAEWMMGESLMMGGATRLRIPLIAVGIGVALVVAGGATAMLRWYGALFLGPVRTPAQFPASRSFTAAMILGGVFGWGAALSVGWLSPWIARLAPLADGARPPLVLAPTFTHPSAASILVPLGGRIFDGLPGVPGMILFPGPAFTVTSPWDMFWFGGLLVGLVFGVRAVGLRWRSPRPVRRVPTWVGGTPYGPEFAWSASGITHPLRVAFAPVIQLRRTRSVEGRTVAVQVDAVDRLVEHGFHPLVDAVTTVLRKIQRVHDGELSHYLVYMLMGFGALLIGLKLTGML